MNHNQLLALRLNNKLLRENVDVSPMIPVLVKDRVIREEHIGMIERGATRRDKAKLFFEDVLIRKGFGGYWSVIRALRQTKQFDIANILENTICDSTGDLPRDRLKKRRKITLRPVRHTDCDEATSGTEDRVLSFLQEQCQSTAASSLRESILDKYSFYVEQLETIPVCLVTLARRVDKLAQFDRDVSTGKFSKFVVSNLKSQDGFKQLQRDWSVEVTVQREQPPEGAVEEEETDEEYDSVTELGAPGVLQTDCGPSAGSSNTFDSGIGSYSSAGTSSSSCLSVDSMTEEQIQRHRKAQSMIELHIKSHEYSAKDLHQLMVMNIRKGISVQTLRDIDGLSLLHQVVAVDRSELFIVFYDLGLLGDMHRARVINSDSPYHDMTPLAMAEHDRKRCREDLETFIKKEKRLTKLCRIARKGDIERLRSYVERKPEEVHYRADLDGSFPVYWACVANSKPCLDYLIQNGGDVKDTTKDNEHVLTKAASLGHYDMVRYLIKKHHVDPNVKGSKKRTALERAAETGDYNVFHVLLKHRATLVNFVLHAASRTGQINFIQRVMENYSSQLNVNGRDASHRTPLHHAADNAHVTTLQALMSYGGDITMLDKRRRNVLHYLADSFCTEGIVAVIEQACRRSVLSVVINQQELYLGAEQCFLVRGRDKGKYAWHYVIVDRGQLSIFKRVINRGHVDVGRYGRIMVSGWGLAPSQETTEQIAKRYDVTIVRDGARPDMAPLHYSLIRDNEPMATKLIQNGADVNLKDSFGLTPLHLAAMRGQLPVVKLLESRGANLEARDNKMRRPLEVAEANKHTHVANFLKSAQDISKCKNFTENQLAAIQRELAMANLDRIRNSGQDLRLHLIQQLRELESRIHDLLFDVGSTPVMQATSPEEPANNGIETTREAEQLTAPRGPGSFTDATLTLGGSVNSVDTVHGHQVSRGWQGGAREAVAALGGRVGEDREGARVESVAVR